MSGEHEVDKCWACPFHVMDSHQNNPTCHAPGTEEYQLIGQPDEPPDWCPLPITIRTKA